MPTTQTFHPRVERTLGQPDDFTLRIQGVRFDHLTLADLTSLGESLQRVLASVAHDRDERPGGVR